MGEDMKIQLCFLTTGTRDKSSCYLFNLEDVAHKELLQVLIGVVYTQLLEAESNNNNYSFHVITYSKHLCVNLTGSHCTFLRKNTRKTIKKSYAWKQELLLAIVKCRKLSWFKPQLSDQDHPKGISGRQAMQRSPEEILDRKHQGLDKPYPQIIIAGDWEIFDCSRVHRHTRTTFNAFDGFTAISEKCRLVSLPVYSLISFDLNNQPLYL